MYNACQDGDMSALAEDLCGRLREINNLNILSQTVKTILLRGHLRNLCWTNLLRLYRLLDVFSLGQPRSRDHELEIASDAFVSIFSANDYCG